MAAVINLRDLIDLAVGSKNQDEINFKVLQTTLQAIVQHLNIQDTKIEFRGSDSDNIQNIVKKVQDDDLKKIQLNIVPDQPEAIPKETPLDDQSVLTADSTGGKKKRQDSLEDVVVVESGKVQEPFKRRLISPSFLTRLEAKVKALQGQIEALGAQVLPSDDALLQTTRSQQEAKPISDLWQSLNITKRMSGAEEGIDKLASLLETVAKEYADLKVVIDKLEEELGQDMVETMKQIKLAANYAKQIRPREEIYQNKLSKKIKYETKGVLKTPGVEQVQQVPQPVRYEQKVQLSPSDMSSQVYGSKRINEAEISESEIEVGEAAEFETDQPKPVQAGYASQMDTAMEEAVDVKPTIRDSFHASLQDSITSGKKVSLDSQALFDVITPIPRGEGVEREKVNLLLAQHEYMKQNVEYLTAQVNTLVDFTENQLPDMIRSQKKSKQKKDEITPGGRYTKDTAVDQKLQDIEGRIAKHSSKLKRQDVMITEKTMDYDKRLSSLSQTVSEMFDTINTSQNDDNQNGNIIEDLITKVQNIEDAVVEVGCNIQDFQEDREHKSNLLGKLATEIELVKTGKADRYEIEDILAEKADCYAVLEKVSQSIFDAACNDLAKGIDEALNRVSAQESLLAATMLELQNAIDNKFDRDEIEPLKEELMEKIDHIVKRVEKLSAMKEGRVAAGAKKKYITDVNCISCDRNVSMKIENDVPCIPALADLPVMHSLAPYISYELDHLRKMKAKQPGPGTLLEYEDLAKRYNIKNLNSYENLIDVPHLQTRYCGGSHTKLGPQQRVTHVGHFNIVKNINEK